MNTKEFKKLFEDVACKKGFEAQFGGLFKESNECIIVLDLQKSNFSNYIYLNIKIYIQGMFDRNYYRSKDLVKKEVGNISRNQPNEYKDIFDFDNSIPEDKRKNGIEKLFDDFLVPLANKALTRIGIEELNKNQEIDLLPAVEKQLQLLNDKKNRVKSI